MIPAKQHIKSLERIRNATSRAGFLRLDKNEGIAALDKEFVDKLKKEITADFLTSYPEADSLYKNLAKWIGCRPENLYITAGSDAAIKAVFEVFVNPGDIIAYVSPTYAMVHVYARMFQTKPAEIHYGKDLSLTAEEVLKVLKENQPKMIYIANPNSPTGTVIPPDGVKKIIETADKQNTVVLLDEAYYLFYPHTQIGIINEHPNLIVTRTFSKAFGLAAGRLGFAAAHADTISVLEKVRPMYEANALAIRFADIALNTPGFVEKSVKRVLDGKKYLEDELDKLGIKYYKSFANFMMINVGSFEKSVQVGNNLYQKQILIKSGLKEDMFRNYIRVSIGSTDQMKTFLDNFKEVYFSAGQKK